MLFIWKEDRGGAVVMSLSYSDMMCITSVRTVQDVTSSYKRLGDEASDSLANRRGD